MDLIIQGDSQRVLKKIPDDFVDLICTDPPYGIKFMGKDWDKAIPKREIWIECLRILKPGAFAFVMCTPRQDCLARLIVDLEDTGFAVGFTSIYWAYAQGFPKAQNLSKVADKRAGVEREVVGTQRTGCHKGFCSLPEAEKYVPITAPATPEAKALDGAYGGFQPKPAVEVILVVMKPPDHKTWIDQALDNGKGCTWLDAGRIPTENDFKLIPAGPRGKGVFGDGGKWDRQKIIPKNQGRFPANLIASDDSLNDGRENKSSFSRYFSLDSWWEKRIEFLPGGVRKTFPFLLTPKASRSEKTHKGKIENKHPTVKPLKLMSWLVSIGSREGDLVVDPFCGSGTTCLAAKMLKRDYLGIDLDQESVRITKERLALI